MTKLIFLILCLIKFSAVLCFNLSPTPNTIIKKPTNIKLHQKQTRSSLFGFSINLRKDHLMVGSPRAETSIDNQRKIKETGSIFKCELNEDKDCYPYIFDNDGNNNDYSKSTRYESLKKDFQMLGFSMDGNTNGSDKFVVCAPHLKSTSFSGNFTEDKYMLHGICYWTSETNSKRPITANEIAPLRLVTQQSKNCNGRNKIKHFMYAESGFSVHVTEDNDEIIIGSPGMLLWKGSIIRAAKSKFQNNNLAKNDIPSPCITNLPDDSYFGYAVSSAKFLGQNSSQLFYVASAPRVNETGEVYIFEIEDDIEAGKGKEKAMKIYTKFSGTKYGEYFGYALLCEDFNGDGLPDIAISAPMHSKNGYHDPGAVYVYINDGNLSFTKSATLYSNFEGSGRFGSSLSKIGDINLDGYNDLIVSAPFEGNGTVYVFLGSKSGILATSSQKIQAPLTPPPVYDEAFSKPMFGHSLSRGVDVDDNGYPDIAIGAPNSETVYIYRTYPVIKVFYLFNLSKRKLTLEDNTIVVEFCARYDSASNMTKEIKLTTLLSLDTEHSRASKLHDKMESTILDSLNITNKYNCQNHTLFIKENYAKIFEPILIEIKYDTYHKIPRNGTKFCDECVAIDPRDSNTVTSKISFFTGCKGERCQPDLSVIGKLVNVRQPFVLGSKKTMNVKFEISNAGESAYMTQIKIKLSTNSTRFSRIPSSCSDNDQNEMSCAINSGKPIKNGERAEITIDLDLTKLEGGSFWISAEVSSIGDEKLLDDNKHQVEVMLAEFSDIELNGKSSSIQLSLGDGLTSHNLLYEYEIFNNGPSNVKELSIILQIPLLYVTKSYQKVELVDINEIDIKVTYGSETYEVNWVHNQTSSKISLASRINAIGMLEDINDNLRLNHDYVANNDEQDIMSKRSIAEDTSKIYNKYTESVTAQSNQHSVQPENDNIKFLNLAKTRTIVYSCLIKNDSVCADAEMVIHNFIAGNEPIMIKMNFSMDMTQFDKIFTETKNIFLFKTNTIFHRIGDSNRESLKIRMRNPFTVIYGKIRPEMPIGVLILSIIIGILVFILLSYSLYKFGFFRRSKKEELVQLKRQSAIISASMSRKIATKDD